MRSSSNPLSLLTMALESQTRRTKRIGSPFVATCPPLTRAAVRQNVSTADIRSASVCLVALKLGNRLAQAEAADDKKGMTACRTSPETPCPKPPRSKRKLSETPNKTETGASPAETKKRLRTWDESLLVRAQEPTKSESESESESEVIPAVEEKFECYSLTMLMLTSDSIPHTLVSSAATITSTIPALPVTDVVCIHHPILEEDVAKPEVAHALEDKVAFAKPLSSPSAIIRTHQTLEEKPSSSQHPTAERKESKSFPLTATTHHHHHPNSKTTLEDIAALDDWLVKIEPLLQQQQHCRLVGDYGQGAQPVGTAANPKEVSIAPSTAGESLHLQSNVHHIHDLSYSRPL